VKTVLEDVLVEYETRQSEEDVLIAKLSPEELGRRRDDFLVSIGRATGLLLNILARESRARSILELGTGLGYSTIWLADAARATGGKVLTLDLVPAKHRQAKLTLQRTELLDYVRFQLHDALDFLASTNEIYDFVLLDLWKDVYIPCIDALLPRLQPGATIVADNMLEPASVRFAAIRYQTHVRSIPDLQTVLLPVGSGIAVSRYQVRPSLACR
jgi:predicted O-methyltransferase YrrM